MSVDDFNQIKFDSNNIVIDIGAHRKKRHRLLSANSCYVSRQTVLLIFKML